MAVTETLMSRWIRRYKCFFLLGILILGLQIYLAFKLPIFGTKDEIIFVDKKSSQSKSPSVKFKDLVIDDEDIHSNSNAYSLKLTRNLTQHQHGPHMEKEFYREDFNFVANCNISSRETISAIQRARTDECKKYIANISCAIQTGKLYSKSLPNTCPNGCFIANRALGCFKDEKKFRILSGYYTNFKTSNSPEKCIQMCLQSGFLYAGVQYSTECFCGNEEPSVSAKLPDPNCNMKCSGDPKQSCGGYFTINIYETGIAKFSPQVAELMPKSGERPIRIAFLLTLNGRAVRQVRRLLKTLYSEQHLYYIHIDSRQSYMFRELEKLESKYKNIILARKRYSTIWGGASLLQMLLASMKELLELNIEWDFVINLSESDFPVKTVDKLVKFLTANKDKNFVKSHGREVQRFIQKQGLDKTFVECDTHMWRIGDRELPGGIQIDGGSDWVALSRPFVKYVTANEKDELIKGLLTIFRFTLLPAESFFHTALRNSHFCNSYIDNNLHVTNWKRRLGCKCQYKHVVDWCGCSPNDFKPEDWSRLQVTEVKQLFFARKFEPIINQAIILQLEEWLFGAYPENTPGLNNYWQNVYHNEDSNTSPDEALLTLAKGLVRINTKSMFKNNYEIQAIKEINLFIENDIHKGFLIMYEVKTSTEQIYTLESRIESRPTTQITKNINLSKRIKSFEVSSDYDQKEQISRNFIKILGSNAEPTLVFRLSGSQSENQTSCNLTVLWINPVGNLVDISETHIEDLSVLSINFVKINVKQPLLPGIWTVKLIYKKLLLAQCKFLIIPIEAQTQLAHNNNKYNGLKKSDMKSNDWSQFLSKIDDRAILLQNTIADINKVGLDLLKWIDNLINHFYIIKSTCTTKTVKQLENYDLCYKTLWSSLSPDPKQDVDYFDNRTT